MTSVNVVKAGLDRRREPRSRSDLSATIRVLPGGQAIRGRIVELASHGMAVVSPERLEAGAAVAVTYRDVLIFSEVVYCGNHSVGEYRVGMKVDQALATGDLTVREAESEIRTHTSSCLTDTVLVPPKARSFAAGM